MKYLYFRENSLFHLLNHKRASYYYIFAYIKDIIRAVTKLYSFLCGIEIKVGNISNFQISIIDIQIKTVQNGD